MNDEGTALSLAAGAVPFLVLRAVRHHAPLRPTPQQHAPSRPAPQQLRFFPLLDISTLKKIAIGVQLYM